MSIPEVLKQGPASNARRSCDVGDAKGTNRTQHSARIFPRQESSS